MSFERPTLEDLIARTNSELAQRLGLGPLQPRSTLGVLGRVSAGLAHSAHGHIELVADQIFPATADRAHLERHASLRGLSRKAATFAGGFVTFAGAQGAEVPMGARLARADGQVYETTEAAHLVSGEATVAVSALLPGAAGNAVLGTLLALQTPALGVMPQATAGEIAGGSDQESDDDLRARVLASWRARPMAGTVEDYERWALEVVGITRAYVRARTPTLGQVTVYVVADGNSPTVAPTPAQLAAVQEHIDTLRPVTARVRVASPVIEQLPLEIELAPASPALRIAVAANLADAVRREAEPGGTIHLSRLAVAISATPGEIYHRIVSPASDVTAGANTLLELGAITWA